MLARAVDDDSSVRRWKIDLKLALVRDGGGKVRALGRQLVKMKLESETRTETDVRFFIRLAFAVALASWHVHGAAGGACPMSPCQLSTPRSASGRKPDQPQRANANYS